MPSYGVNCGVGVISLHNCIDCSIIGLNSRKDGVNSSCIQVLQLIQYVLVFCEFDAPENYRTFFWLLLYMTCLFAHSTLRYEFRMICNGKEVL